MANQVDRQITQEGPRNVVVKWTGILDSSDIVEIPALSLDDCINNDQQLSLIGFRVDLIEWSMSKDLEIQLAWQGTNPQQIYPLSGRGRIYGANYGGFIPDSSRAGYTGNLQLVSNGFVPGQVANFTIVLELVKLYSTGKNVR